MTFFLYAVLLFATALLGGGLPMLIPSIHDTKLKLYVCLGAGLLLGMAFLHMLPEAAELLPGRFGLWFLGGFVLLLVLERFLMVHPCEEHGCDYHTIGVAAFAGLTIHGVIEGLALASSIYVTELGPLVLVAILSHKAPQGFALTSILKMSTYSRTRIWLFLTGVAASGPLGILLGYLFMSTQPVPNAAGALLAMSAGTFVYIGACDLLPELHGKDLSASHGKFTRLATFMVGIGLSLVSEVLMHH